MEFEDFPRSVWTAAPVPMERPETPAAPSRSPSPGMLSVYRLSHALGDWEHLGEGFCSVSELSDPVRPRICVENPKLRDAKLWPVLSVPLDQCKYFRLTRDRIITFSHRDVDKLIQRTHFNEALASPDLEHPHEVCFVFPNKSSCLGIWNALCSVGAANEFSSSPVREQGLGQGALEAPRGFRATCCRRLGDLTRRMPVALDTVSDRVRSRLLSICIFLSIFSFVVYTAFGPLFLRQAAAIDKETLVVNTIRPDGKLFLHVQHFALDYRPCSGLPWPLCCRTCDAIQVVARLGRYPEMGGVQAPVPFFSNAQATQLVQIREPYPVQPGTSHPLVTLNRVLEFRVDRHMAVQTGKLLRLEVFRTRDGNSGRIGNLELPDAYFSIDLDDKFGDDADYTDAPVLDGDQRTRGFLTFKLDWDIPFDPECPYGGCPSNNTLLGFRSSEIPSGAGMVGDLPSRWSTSLPVSSSSSNPMVDGNSTNPGEGNEEDDPDDEDEDETAGGDFISAYRRSESLLSLCIYLALPLFMGNTDFNSHWMTVLAWILSILLLGVGVFSFNDWILFEQGSPVVILTTTYLLALSLVCLSVCVVLFRICWNRRRGEYYYTVQREYIQHVKQLLRPRPLARVVLPNGEIVRVEPRSKDSGRGSWRCVEWFKTTQVYRGLRHMRRDLAVMFRDPEDDEFVTGGAEGFHSHPELKGRLRKAGQPAKGEKVYFRYPQRFVIAAVLSLLLVASAWVGLVWWVDMTVHDLEMIKYRIERVYVETENRRQTLLQLQTDLLRSESVADRYMGEILRDTATLQSGDVRSLCWDSPGPESGPLGTPPESGGGNSTTNGTTVLSESLLLKSHFTSEIRKIQRPWAQRPPISEEPLPESGVLDASPSIAAETEAAAPADSDGGSEGLLCNTWTRMFLAFVSEREAQQQISDFQHSFTVAAYTSGGVGLFTVALGIYLIAKRLRVRLLRMRRGKYFFNPHLFTVYTAYHYIGLQAMHSLLCFGLITLTLGITTFVLSHPWLRERLLSLILRPIATVTIITVSLEVAANLIAKFVLVRDGRVVHLRPYLLFDFAYNFLSIISGLLYATIRSALLIYVVLIQLLRLDLSQAHNPVLASYDIGYSSYINLLLIHHNHNHPVLRVFAGLLIDGARRRSLKQQRLHEDASPDPAPGEDEAPPSWAARLLCCLTCGLCGGGRGRNSSKSRIGKHLHRLGLKNGILTPGPDLDAPQNPVRREKEEAEDCSSRHHQRIVSRWTMYALLFRHPELHRIWVAGKWKAQSVDKLVRNDRRTRARTRRKQSLLMEPIPMTPQTDSDPGNAAAATPGGAAAVSGSNPEIRRHSDYVRPPTHRMKAPAPKPRRHTCGPDRSPRDRTPASGLSERKTPEMQRRRSGRVPGSPDLQDVTRSARDASRSRRATRSSAACEMTTTRQHGSALADVEEEQEEQEWDDWSPLPAVEESDEEEYDYDEDDHGFAYAPEDGEEFWEESLEYHEDPPMQRSPLMDLSEAEQRRLGSESRPSGRSPGGRTRK